MPKYLDLDFAILYAEATKSSKKLLTIVYGDELELIETLPLSWKKVRINSTYFGIKEGFVKGTLPLRNTPIMKVTMVDVQQGDGMILETPEGKIIFIDGGDNKLFARHVAARYKHPANTAATPLEIDAIIVTHGDADHFDGLNEIRRSEDYPANKASKRVFIHPKRVFHNGIVKRPSSVSKETDQLGKSIEIDDRWWITGLHEDPRNAAPADQNQPFKDWVKSLNQWETRGPIAVKRVFHGQDPDLLFDFLKAEGIRVEIQGPFQQLVTDPDTGIKVPALPFFGTPPPSSINQNEQDLSKGGSPSASHTINGHSIALRLTYKNIRINLTGDLNKESMAQLRANIPLAELEAEIVKAPHHGSHDFDLDTLMAMKPLVAMVSSGDESEVKEYIHPRASMMAALGKSMRERNGILFCTELAAFFKVQDYSHSRQDLASFFGNDENKNKNFTGQDLQKLFKKDPSNEGPTTFFGFERTNFGIIHIRTDGERVLVFTHSGKDFVNESYRFDVKMVNGVRSVTFAPDVKTI